MAEEIDPATQAKALKILVLALVIAGLIIGAGMPAVFVALGIQVAMTSMGFDLIWLLPLATMIIDFVLARFFWRRATALDRAAQGLPPANIP